jgi:hypothetical protein
MLKRKLEAVPVALAGLVLSLFSIPSFADSQARIVRLSTVDGNVQIDRNTGQGFERAFVNLPVTQGTKLWIKGEGRAEIEFEDGSTLRIASDTQVEFPQLSLLDSGSKASTVSVPVGIAYINFAGTKDDQLTLMFGREKVAFNRAAHLRLDAERGTAGLAVFKGDVQVEGPAGTLTVVKNQTATFDLSRDDKGSVAKDIEPQAFDAWDKSQDQYHQRYTMTASNSVSPYAFGNTDMAYYGSFSNVPGYGMMWQPFFVGAGWDPFMDGAWAFSPGMGYGWVSAYPWGWTPYHYGSWTYIPTRGWGWQPGGAWTSFATVPHLVNAPKNFAMPQAPTSVGKSTIVVNRGPASTLSGRSTNKLVVRGNSAGLGIPRGSVENVAKASQTVQQGGEFTTKIHPAPVAARTPSGFSRGYGTAQPSSRSNSPSPRPMSSPPPVSRGGGAAPTRK